MRDGAFGEIWSGPFVCVREGKSTGIESFFMIHWSRIAGKEASIIVSKIKQREVNYFRNFLRLLPILYL